MLHGNHLPDVRSKLLGSLQGRHLSPLRLIDPDAVQNGGEFVTILRIVNHFRVSTKNGHAIVLQTQCDVLG